MASANKAGDTFYGAVYFVVWGSVAETGAFLRVPVLVVAKTPRGVVAGVHKVRWKTCTVAWLCCYVCMFQWQCLWRVGAASCPTNNPRCPCPLPPS
jgi:hypothetical protein